jgi:phosphopentomutase
MLFVTLVLDGAGVGRAPDAAAYGDAGADTLGHVCAAARPALPNLTRWGLGRAADLAGVPAAAAPAASWGTMAETAAGKDSTIGHWELAGVVLDRPFPTYPGGFPPEVLDAFVREAGVEGVLGNRPASGTEIIAELGEEHVRTGHPIVYTSGDSVFQVAAHVDVVPLERLYAMCEAARERVCVGPHAVGRVIARPFTGAPGAFSRLSAARKDLSLRPPGPAVQEALRRAGVRTVAVGKIGALFAGVGFDVEAPAKGNADGVEKTLAAIREAAASGAPTFVWTNLVDFDELYGHRNDPAGFARALEAFDAALPALEAALPPGARLVVTADHGNDPCFPGTDHTRERVPLLVFAPGGPGGPLGDRATFADHAASVAAYFGVPWDGPGTSFL